MSLGLVAAAEQPNLPQPIYDADPQHLWNRLHDALFVRVGPDGESYGQDRLEPLLWIQSKHLLESPSHDRAVAALNEFLDNDGERLVDEPLKRALLQRDLWMVFNWLEGEHRDFEQPAIHAYAARGAIAQLRSFMAAVIGRLALTRDQINRLPDNYAAAVASGNFANQFEIEREGNPYLPPDLFDADGPWICIGRTDGVTAPMHLRPENPYTNSVFFVFLRVPTDRSAATNHLKLLTTFDQPLVVRNPDETDRRFPLLPNPELPQFPKGTQFALVRRALLIDSAQHVAASPITESVQLRVLRAEAPALSKQVLEDGQGSSPAARERVSAWHAFQEFQLSRARLFARQAGGLRAIRFDEPDFKTGFNAHSWDEFESNLMADRPFPLRAQRFTNRETCYFCHSLPGVYSFASLRDGFRSIAGLNASSILRTHPLSVISVSDVEQAAVMWKLQQPHSSALHKALESQVKRRDVRIRVVDARDDSPIAGLAVAARHPHGYPEESIQASGTTGVDGRVTLDKLAAIDHELLLSAKRQLPYLVRWPRCPADDDDLVIRLQPACDLTLRAVDAETGRGVPGVKFGRERALAELWMRVVVPDTIGANRLLRYDFAPDPQLPPESDYETDADGYYRCLVGPETWSYMIYQYPPGYRSITPIDGKQEVEIETPGGGKVEYIFRLRHGSAAAGSEVK